MRSVWIGLGIIALAVAIVAAVKAGGEERPPRSEDLGVVLRAVGELTAPLRVSERGNSGEEIPAVPGPSYEVARAQAGSRIELHSSPGGPQIAELKPHTEFGADRTFYVAQRRGEWLGVTSDAAPDNGLAWVREDPAKLTLSHTNYSLRADLSERAVEIRYGDHVVKRFPVSVGRSGSETPPGTYSVTDALAGEGVGPYYGCCVMALTGHQPNLPPGWIGGDRIAIHGTPGEVGGAASLGCLRARDEDMAALFLLVPLGTPVFIRA